LNKYSVDFIEGFPALLGGFDVTGRLNGALHPRRPDFEVVDPLRLDKVVEHLCVLPAVLRKIRIAADLAVQVVHTFAVSSQVDGPGKDVNVHQVVNDPALNVAFVTMDQDLGTRIEDLHETEVGFEDLVQRLILRFVVLDAKQEIVEDRLVLRVLVIRTIHFHFFDGGLDDLGIVADRLDEEQFVAHLLDDDVVYGPTSVPRRISRVKHGHFSAGFDPVAGVFQGVQGDARSQRHGFSIVRPEEFVIAVGFRRLTTVLAQIEHFSVNSDPIQISG